MTSYEQPGLFPAAECSPPAGPAREIRSQAVVAAWLTHVRDCGGTSCGCWLTHAPAGSSARTCTGSFRSTAAGTSGPSSVTWMSWGTAWRGEFWTRNGSECPSGAAVSSLPDVLETGPHLSRYFLSPKAAAGILRTGRQAAPEPAGTAGRRAGSTRGAGPGGHRVASTLQGGGRRGHRVDAEGAAGGHLIAHAITAPEATGPDPDATTRFIVTHAPTAEGADAPGDGTGTPPVPVVAPLTAGTAAGAGMNAAGRRMEDDGNLTGAGEAVRRLTPRECERLQGFPDDWTRWLADGTGQPDSARYRRAGQRRGRARRRVDHPPAGQRRRRGPIADRNEAGRMTDYVRTCGGQQMTVHAPRAGELDRAALTAFTAAEPVLGLDVETSALDDHGPRFFAPAFTVRLVQFGSEREAWVLDMTDPGQRDAAAAVLTGPARRFVTHTPFDVLAVWSALGIPLGQRVADTHLLSKLLDPDERAGHGLKELAARHLDGGLGEAEAALHARMRALAPAGQRAGNAPLRWGWNHLPPGDEAYVVYAGLDAIYVRRLLPVLLAACAPFAHLARLDTWLAAQATGITVRGLRLDTGYARGLLADLEAEHAAADAQITAALGCPGASPKFADWLDGQAAAAGITGLPRTPTGRLQVTAESLTGLLDQHAAALPERAAGLARARLAMSKASNLIANLRAFLAAADAGGRVHPQVNTLRAKTARMSITNPALQTLKKHDPRLRRCFAADPGHVLISCDFSQVEIRVAAALADDPTLRQVILSGRGHPRRHRGPDVRRRVHR